MYECPKCGNSSFEILEEGKNINIYRCTICGAVVICPKSLDEIHGSILSKNEFLALELTKAWCGQSGMPTSSDLVLVVYNKFLKDLDEHNNKKEE